MVRRVLASTMVLAAVLMAGESVYAAPMTALRIPVNAKMGKTKQTISFHLRNDSSNSMQLRAGGQEMTLEPGKLIDVTLKIGDIVVVAKGTPSFPEGAVVATVSPELKDTTIALR